MFTTPLSSFRKCQSGAAKKDVRTESGRDLSNGLQMDVELVSRGSGEPVATVFGMRNLVSLIISRLDPEPSGRGLLALAAVSSTFKAAVQARAEWRQAVLVHLRQDPDAKVFAYRRPNRKDETHHIELYCDNQPWFCAPDCIGCGMSCCCCPCATVRAANKEDFGFFSIFFSCLVITFGIPAYPIMCMTGSLSLACGALFALPKFCQRKSKPLGVVVTTGECTNENNRTLLNLEMDDSVTRRFRQLIWADRYLGELEITDWLTREEHARLAPDRVLMVD